MGDVRADRDIRTYRWAALTLRAGMYASLAAMGAGLVWWLLAGMPGGEASASTALPLGRIPGELVAGNPLALVSLGVFLLLATPGVTLFAEIVAFALDRNWIYVAISALVGFLLSLSLVLSLAL
jgi:uncharacterized membrane protein